MRQEFDVFAEYQFAHSLLRALAERLAFLRHVYEGEACADFLLVGGQHLDCVAVGYAITQP